MAVVLLEGEDKLPTIIAASNVSTTSAPPSASSVLVSNAASDRTVPATYRAMSFAYIGTMVAALVAFV